MLGTGPMSWNLYEPETEPVYQLKSKLGYEPGLLYKSKFKIDSTPEYFFYFFYFFGLELLESDIGLQP